MLPVELHPEATRELEESFYWYDGQAPGLGAEFLDEVERGIAAIRERPDTWPVFTNETRRHLIHRFPFGLVYEHDSTGVRILAVMHLHRRPGYWVDRRRS